MRLLLRILCLAFATTSFAIPLHIGETWTWQVQGSSGTGWRRACVVDSAALDSSMPAWNYRKTHAGSLWRIAVLDSLREDWDTARLVSYADGIQLWERESRYLALEFTPLSVLQDSGITPAFGGGIVRLCDLYDASGNFRFQQGYPWGGGSLLAMQRLGRWGQCDENDFRQDFGKRLFWRNDDEVVWGTPFPWLWSDTNGVLRYRDHSRNWELIAHDGQAVSLLGIRWQIPAAGFAWEWIENRTTGSFSSGYKNHDPRHVRDTVIANWGDSAGWARVDLRETDGSASKEYHCRILRSTLSTTRDCPEVAAYWLRDWRAGVADGFALLDERSCTDGHYSVSCSQRFTKIRVEDGLLDSGYASDDDRAYGAMLVYSSVVTRQLMSVNSIAVRSEPVVAIGIGQGSESRLDWRALANRFPETSVRWHDLAGRTGTLRAGDLVKTSANPRLLVLDAAFPDGSRWQGKFLAGGGR